MKILNFMAIAAITLACIACGKQQESRKENVEAKKQLQGIWIDEDEEDVAFRIKGDSVFFPDSAALPARLSVRGDTILLQGASTVGYPIVKLSPHLLVFISQNGEQVRLVKTNDKSYARLFEHPKSTATVINQKHVVKHDTVLVVNDKRYHSYVQVNPTTYKVIKAGYIENGVEVGNAYYDNIIHLGIYQGTAKIFSRNIMKGEFKGIINSQALSQTVFSDLVFDKTGKDGFHYLAVLAVPDSMTSYVVEMIVSFDGKLHKSIHR